VTENLVHEPVDRTDWPLGAWDSEPDRFEWYDEATDMPCLAKRNHMGAWCGYVAVNPDHALHSKGYDDVDVEVHGGLTYASECAGSICHVPRPGEPDNVWWFGFDCAHGGDYMPAFAKYDSPGLPVGSYRTLNYVRAQCTQLAKQLADQAL
jgi:hypothetical protein